MRLRTRKSSLDDWLSRGTNVRRLWKLVFFFFSRFILALCLLHYVGVTYPQIGWVFPGPTSELFWSCCVLFTGIFSTVFYVVRAKRVAGADGSKKPKIKDSPAKVVEEKREGHHGSVGRATFASAAEEKREGHHGGVGRAAFESLSELEEERSEHQGDRRQ